MSAPFPLLRLPFVALCEVFKSTNPIEIISLSFCSRKVKRLIKMCRDKTIKWKIGIFGGSQRKVTLGKGRKIFFQVLTALKNEYKGEKDIVRIEGSEFSIACKNKQLVTLWDHTNWVEGFKFIANYITELLGQTIQQLVVTDLEDIWMNQWIHERQAEQLEVCSYDNEILVSDEDFRNLLNKFHPTTELKLYVRPSNSFRFIGNFPKIDELTITHGPWVTLENLQSMDSVYIYVNETKLESSDMNVFIETWLNGSNSRLKCMHISGQWFEFEDVLRELMDRAVQVNRRREYRTNSHFLCFSESYDIKRNDGFTATIFAIVDLFVMVIWSDSDILVFDS